MSLVQYDFINVNTIPGTLELYKNMNLQTEMSFFYLSPVSELQMLTTQGPSRALQLQHDGPMGDSVQGGTESFQHWYIGLLAQSTHSQVPSGPS